MPEMDGLPPRRSDSTRPTTRRRVPIVALTAGAMQDDRERCVAAGMDEFLAKPLNVDSLVATLARFAREAVGIG